VIHEVQTNNQQLRVFLSAKYTFLFRESRLSELRQEDFVIKIIKTALKFTSKRIIGQQSCFHTFLDTALNLVFAFKIDGNLLYNFITEISSEML